MCILLLQAFVQFPSGDDARNATQKDREVFGEKFGDRYVRVYPTLESDGPDMLAVVMQTTLLSNQVCCACISVTCAELRRRCQRAPCHHASRTSSKSACPLLAQTV